jgi:ribosomal peptide maturation radical SAM protein 1
VNHNILDYRYLQGLCGPLGEEHYDYRFFYEVKANLKREQLRVMARAGIKVIQPGIESLSSHVLSLMRKGVSMLHNVRCLKWASYYRMDVKWNVLYGFPGETEQDYEQQVRLLPLLRHLPPPAGCGPIWLERFSPYFSDDSFPVTNVRPLDVYQYIYPEPALDLSSVAYFFDYDMGDLPPEDAYAGIQREVDVWIKSWENRRKPQLVYQRAPDWIQILDNRGERLVTHAFEGIAAAVYECCGDTDQSISQICKAVAATEAQEIDPATVGEALERFCELGLMLEENGAFLSLALPVNTHW